MIEKIGSAAFYGISSLMIIFANKIVLTSYHFSSFQTLALGQLLVTIVVINLAKTLKLINVSNLNVKTGWKLMPLSVIYFGNLLFGLGGTKSLNLPMFVVLRRFSVLMTMYGELYILKIKKSVAIQISIYMMVFGAIVAASNDLTFDIHGYVFITLNNFFTTANGIYTKRKFEKSNVNENEILYYNALFTIFPLVLLSFYSGEIDKIRNYDGWTDPGFLFFFLVSSIMGFLLNYSWMLCTRFNSPLTTTVIGCLKNILVTYLGIFIGGDYVFSNLNFIGLTISTSFSIYYSYLTFAQKKPQIVSESKPDKSSPV